MSGDTIEMLCNHTLAFSLPCSVEQAPVAVGVHISLDEGDDKDEEEEDYVPSKEQVYRDHSPYVDFGHTWYQVYDDRFSNIENRF